MISAAARSLGIELVAASSAARSLAGAATSQGASTNQRRSFKTIHYDAASRRPHAQAGQDKK